VVIVHIYMEMSQGNFLCSYLYLKQAKMSFWGQNMSCLEGWGELVGKRGRRMIMVQIM
jgi:hypothetical protein